MTLVWTRQGPRPTTGGQAEGLQDNEVVGAIKALAAHPTDPNILYVGAVNGGVWRTDNAQIGRPTWRQLTDAQQSLSIGALEFDPTDATLATLVAGTGRFSSIVGMGGSLTGLLRTTNGGTTWTNINPAGTFGTVHIGDVAPRGATIVVAGKNSGIHRTVNGGTSWTQISGSLGSGLPSGVSFALAGDPTDPTRLYAHIGITGIFASTDTGATWGKVSTAAMDAQLGQAVNVKISVGMADNVYVAIAAVPNELVGLYRSGDNGATWTALDVPSTMEGGPPAIPFGLHPGRQAGIHLSLAADRTAHKVVYIGGDRQPHADEGRSRPVRWPNSIGAQDFSGRLFRVDATQPAGAQAVHLTHSNTASNTAPHADSRGMAIDAQGDLIESDDGGVYRRRLPRSDAADWASMNGDLQITELHSVAWDANTGTAIGGAQDTGVPQQAAPAGARWPSVVKADGAIVVVDDTSSPGFSIRYSSFQSLGGFRREVYDNAGVRRGATAVQMAPLGGAAQVSAQFYTPLELNQVDGSRLIIGAANGVYESDDQGDTVRRIGPGIVANSIGTSLAAPLAYGAQGRPDQLYVGSGASLFTRMAAHPAPLAVCAAYPGTSLVTGIAVPPTQPDTAFVIDGGAVYHTADAGLTWANITGGLLALGGVVLRSVTYCADLNGGSVLIGTNAGVFAAVSPAFAVWGPLGAGLPTAPVMRLRYSPASRVVLAATLGRGAWTLQIP